MRRLLGRFAGFSSLSLISAVIPLFVLPVVARVGSTQEWTAIAAAQAVGGYAATVASVGWSTLGVPKLISVATHREKGEVYADSFYSKVLLLAIVAPVAVLVSILMVPEDVRLLAAISTISSVLYSLSIVWFAVGMSSPGLIARYELLPRLVLSLASVPAIVATRNVYWYPAALLIATLVGLLLFHLAWHGRAVPEHRSPRRVRAIVTDHRVAWSAEIVGNLHSSAPVPIAAAALSSAAGAAYASGDRLYRYSLIGIVAVGNTLQGWVLSAERTSAVRRQLVALSVHFVLGVGGWVVLAFFGAPATSLLFGSRVAARPDVMWVLGLCFFAVSLSTPLIRNTLIPARRDRTVLAATVAGAVVGIIAMVAFAIEGGAIGIAVGLAVSEMIVLVVTAAGSVRLLKFRRPV